MAASKTIDQNIEIPAAQDYAFLRKEGISLIQSLSGEIWTDYNTHDPGITLLEAMCYALTDLGYRASFDMKDILAPEKSIAEGWKNIFYTARQILPCNPLTLLDYRKVVIDTEGVRNAWIEKSDEYEILMFLQEAGKKYFLTYDAKKSEEIIRLRGLYKVFVEFEDHIIEESKQDEVSDTIRKKLQNHRNLCEDFLSVASVDYENFPIEAVIQVSEGADVEMINARIYKVIQDFFSPPVNFYSLEQMMNKKGSSDEVFKGPVLKYGFIDSEELVKSERFKDIHLSDIIHLISGLEGVIAVKRFTFGNTPSPFANFTEWINNVKDKQKAPKLDIARSDVSFERNGDRHREGNRQPDKNRVKAIFSFLQSGDFKTKLKGVSKDLNVPAGEFMVIDDYYPFQKSLPVMYGMSESFIDTNIDGSSVINAVNELLDRKVGRPLRVIFNKFLDETERHESVKAIAGLFENAHADKASVRELVDELLSNPSDFELLKAIVTKLHKTREDYNTVKELLHRFIDEHPVNSSVSDRSANLQRIASNTIKKSLLDINDQEEIFRLKESYIKLQLTNLQKRKKTVLQLRGFLLVFEQVMADYLSQLSHTRELFSFNPVHQTFYPQALKHVNDLESLFINLKNYTGAQLNLLETDGAFLKKRNAILDHLMSRFSESFKNYDLFMKQYLGKQAGKQLIDDKMSMLSDYIEISSYRGTGYNYIYSEQTWNSDNVEGLKKRICKLLGIKSYARKIIASPFIQVKKTVHNEVTKYYVELTNPHHSQQVLLKSVEYEFEIEARIILNYILEEGIDKNYYHQEGRKDKWEYHLKRATQENDFEPIAYGEFYQSRELRDDAFKKTLEVLNEFSNDENFHVLEHILLRPRIGPREQLRKSASGKAEGVGLLNVRLVPETQSEVVSKTEEIRYRFKEKQLPDPGNKENALWKLSLLKDEIEFLNVNEDFEFYKHLTRRIRHIREFGANVSNYNKEIVDGTWVFTLTADKRYLAQSKRNYNKKEEMEQEIASLVEFFSYDHGVVNDLIDDESVLYNADPYSLQVSVFIPAWHRRFRDPAFKHLFEKTIFMETPSHIYPHVYWLDHKEMKEFEDAYKVWVEEIAANEIPDLDIVNRMIATFNDLTK